jgi:RNA polymerase sigma factor (sigma-70 family)
MAISVKFIIGRGAFSGGSKNRRLELEKGNPGLHRTIDASPFSRSKPKNIDAPADCGHYWIEVDDQETKSMDPILHHVRRMALLQAGSSLTDAALLELFLDRREEAAFEALLRRHAPMVLGVCRRVLRHTQDAEDACQATFLVLARKAASLRSRDLLVPWLYGIALRTALKARAMNSKRRARECEVRRRAWPETPADESSEELLARLDTEIDGLPEKYRVPVVLCELQGKSRKEVATILGLPEGTLSSRLAYARKLLAKRLRTTQALSGALLLGVLTRDGLAAVPRSLLKASARAGVKIVSGQVLRAGAVSAQVLVLAEGVMKAMLLGKLKGVGAVVLALALGAGGVTYHQVWAQTGGGGNSGSANLEVGRQDLRAGMRADELDELRMEVAALRKGLEATRERVKVLEHRLEAQGPSNALGGAVLENGSGASSGGGAVTGVVTTKDGGGVGLRQIGQEAPAGGAGRPQTGQGVPYGTGMGGVPPVGGARMRGAPPGGGLSILSTNARQIGGAGLMTGASPYDSVSSAVAALESAAKALRQHPGDIQAADALNRVQQALRVIQARQSQSQPGHQ